jgi:hypothetical protein
MTNRQQRYCPRSKSWITYYLLWVHDRQLQTARRPILPAATTIIIGGLDDLSELKFAEAAPFS